MPVKLTQEEAEARCLANGYQWPEGFVYEGSQKKYPLICLKCGGNRPKKFNDVVRAGCMDCATNAWRLTHDEVVERCLAAKYPAQLLEPYKGHCGVKHLYRFLECGHEWEITPNSLWERRGCGECFFDQGPTYVYLMEHDDLNAYKIGITPVGLKLWRSRIRQHERKGWTLVHKIELATRKEALGLEKAIVDSWRAQGWPAGVTAEQIDKGHGETVSRKHVNKQHLIYSLRSCNTDLNDSEKDAGALTA